jgi:hypothetical protein
MRSENGKTMRRKSREYQKGESKEQPNSPLNIRSHSRLRVERRVERAEEEPNKSGVTSQNGRVEQRRGFLGQRENESGRNDRMLLPMATNKSKFELASARTRLMS